MTALLNTRILASLAMIVFVGAIVASSTGAFFSDTETSTGNTFTAGAIDLQIDNSSYGFDWNNPAIPLDQASGVWGPNAANSWQLSDLTNQLFFSFRDLKPGDYGEDTISLHVNNNDAYACMAFDLTGTPENGQNEPEAAADATAGADEGELQNYLSFLFWYDDGDNILEDNETVIPELSGAPGSVFSGSWLPIAEGGDTPLPGGSTQYIGKGWCFGTITADPEVQNGNGDGAPTADTTGFTCTGAGGDHNDAQTDGIQVDVGFYAVQSRNNAQFQCAGLPPFGDNEQRAEVGADLTAYVAPTGDQCDATVNTGVGVGGTNFHTIQSAIDDAGTVNGETICVSAGTYNEDVNVSKEIELAGAGAASTFIVGQTAGEAGAVVISANNVTVRGFNIIDASGGIAALRINGAHSGILVNSNNLRANGANAFLTNGGVSNVTVSNNVLDANGTAAQLAYVNGTASVATASSNVDFFENSFVGTMGIAGGIVLGNEATGANITENDFASSLTSTYAILESFEDDALVNTNNFNGVGGVKVIDSDAGAGPLNAQNNWWGAAVPAGHTAGNVDDTGAQASAYLLN